MLLKYQRLVLELRQQISSGKLAAGARLPTEEELTARHNLARGTVRKAIAQLETEGLIRTEHGVGSFVSLPWPSAVPFRFSEPFGATGQVHYRLLRQAVLPASIELAALLKIVLGAPVIHIAQLKLEGEAVVSYSERFLPHALCPALANADLTRESVHDILSGSAEEPPVRAAIEIEAKQLAPDDAQLLGVAPGTPAVVVSRMSYTAPARPAVWYRGLFKRQYVMGVFLDDQAAI